MTRARAKEIFLDALDLTGAERTTYIRAACGGDTELQARVEGLLEGFEGADAALGSDSPAAASPPLAGLAASALDELDVGPGERIGAYRLDAMLGEGGFGRVFRARQLEPVEQDVALKVLKLGMDTRQVLARFEAERQALALMDHPHIAGVLDAGSTETGRPYFVIELVDGEPISAFCRRRRSDVRERVELVQEVCLAIQHAHGKGLLHRDIKPSNVLVSEVDGEPVPRVIDFGVAKAMGGDRSDASSLTGDGHIIGTPAYMSPEQAGAERDVDVRSDVYSLGVLLFELLAGEPPFLPKGQHTSELFELQRRIREEDAPPPSAVARGVVDAIPRELDWIAQRCLEKDRERRYATANELALDLGRFLDDLPVEAAPPSRTYRMRKLLRRHRAAASAVAAAFLALLVGGIGTTVGFVREARANTKLDEALKIAELEAEAKRMQAEIADAVNGFLTNDLLKAAQPSADPGQGPELRVIELLDRAARKLDGDAAPGGRFAAAPQIEARIRFAIAETYVTVGRAAEAVEQFERTLPLYRRAEGDAHLYTLRTRRSLASARLGAGDPAAAEAELRALLPVLREHLEPKDHEILTAIGDLATSVFHQGRVDEAEALYREGIEQAERLVGEDDRDTLFLCAGLAVLLSSRGDPEAVLLFERAAEGWAAIVGEDAPRVLGVRANLAVHLRRVGRLDEARTILEEIAEVQARVMGVGHPETVVVRLNLGSVVRDLGDPVAAEPILAAVLEDARRAMGLGHPTTLAAGTALARVYELTGRTDEAGAIYLEVVEHAQGQLGAEHAETRKRLQDYGRYLFESGRADEAVAVYADELERSEAALGPLHAEVLTGWLRLGVVHRAAGDDEGADACFATCAERTAGQAAGSPLVLTLRDERLRLYTDNGRWDEAEELLVDSWDRLERELGEAHRTVAATAGLLAQVYERMGLEGEAAHWRERAGGQPPR